jgi:hypothetical protein
MIRLKAGIALVGENPENTVLDAERNGRALLCEDVGESVSIEGITILNGLGTEGGGMLVVGSSNPRILRCHFRDCWVDSDGVARGGAVSCSSAIFEECIFVNNRLVAIGFEPAQGGAIYSSGPCTITRCNFRENLIQGVRFDAFGGAVMMSGNDGRIVECSFYGNSSFASEGSLAIGGGVYVEGAVSIERSIFVDNRVRRSPQGFPGVGGAIYSGPNSSIQNCTLLGNSAGEGVGGIATDGVVEATLIVGTPDNACGGSGTWRCCNLFGNGGGDMICGIDGGNNFSADPGFCSADPALSMDFRIRIDSSCAPNAHPPGAEMCPLVGAGPVGCGPTAVQQRSWATVKMFYR